MPQHIKVNNNNNFHWHTYIITTIIYHHHNISPPSTTNLRSCKTSVNGASRGASRSSSCVLDGAKGDGAFSG